MKSWSWTALNECAGREDSSPASAPCRRGSQRPLVTVGPAEPASKTVGTCVPPSRPSSSSCGVLLTATQQGMAGSEGTATAPVHAAPPLLSLIFLPFTDIVLVCAHTLTRLMKWAACSGHTMPAPIVTVTSSHGHVVPLRPCWKQERGTRVPGNGRNLKNRPFN